MKHAKLLYTILEALKWAEEHEIRHGGLKFRLFADTGYEFGHVYGAARMLEIVVEDYNTADAISSETDECEPLNMTDLTTVTWETY